eukprot:Awhi_evm1s6362
MGRRGDNGWSRECECCESGRVESVAHFMLHCSLFSDVREKLLDNINFLSDKFSDEWYEGDDVHKCVIKKQNKEEEEEGELEFDPIIDSDFEFDEDSDFDSDLDLDRDEYDDEGDDVIFNPKFTFDSYTESLVVSNYSDCEHDFDSISDMNFDQLCDFDAETDDDSHLVCDLDYFFSYSYSPPFFPSYSENTTTTLTLTNSSNLITVTSNSISSITTIRNGDDLNTSVKVDDPSMSPDLSSLKSKMQSYNLNNDEIKYLLKLINVYVLKIWESRLSFLFGPSEGNNSISSFISQEGGV